MQAQNTHLALPPVCHILSLLRETEIVIYLESKAAFSQEWDAAMRCCHSHTTSGY